MPFNHEKLRVYQRTLFFNSKVSVWTAQWDNKHSVVHHFSRAAGSILENIAMSSASFSGMKTKSLNYAIGSSLECAACLDLACLKQLLDTEMVYTEKKELSQILRMLVGLRTSWDKKRNVVREEQAGYEVDRRADKAYDKVYDKVYGKVSKRWESNRKLI